MKLNSREVLTVVLLAEDVSMVGTVKFVLLLIEDISAGLLVGLANDRLGNTIDGNCWPVLDTVADII